MLQSSSFLHLLVKPVKFQCKWALRCWGISSSVLDTLLSSSSAVLSENIFHFMIKALLIISRIKLHVSNSTDDTNLLSYKLKSFSLNIYLIHFDTKASFCNTPHPLRCMHVRSFPFIVHVCLVYVWWAATGVGTATIRACVAAAGGRKHQEGQKEGREGHEVRSNTLGEQAWENHGNTGGQRLMEEGRRPPCSPSILRARQSDKLCLMT